MPLQPVRTSNSSLSSRAFFCVRRFEVAYRLVFVRPALAREYMNIILVRKDYSVRSSKPNPCMPGLGQGHGKKRQLHAHSPVNFKELKCYKDSNPLIPNPLPNHALYNSQLSKSRWHSFSLLLSESRVFLLARASRLRLISSWDSNMSGGTSFGRPSSPRAT